MWLVIKNPYKPDKTNHSCTSCIKLKGQSGRKGMMKFLKFIKLKSSFDALGFLKRHFMENSQTRRDGILHRKPFKSSENPLSPNQRMQFPSYGTHFFLKVSKSKFFFFTRNRLVPTAFFPEKAVWEHSSRTSAS